MSGDGGPCAVVGVCRVAADVRMATARRENGTGHADGDDFGLRVGGRWISIVMPLLTEQQHVVLSAAKSEFSSNILYFLVFDKARLEAFDLGFQHGALPRLHEPHRDPHAHLQQRSSDAALNGVWLYASGHQLPVVVVANGWQSVDRSGNGHRIYAGLALHLAELRANGTSCGAGRGSQLAHSHARFEAAGTGVFVAVADGPVRRH